jgi:hypothetical protein
MNFALEVFEVREAFVTPYSVPADDVLSDDGEFLLYPPEAPVVVSVAVGTLVMRPVSNATGYRLYKRSGTVYSVIATSSDPDLTEFVDADITAPGFYRVIAVNGVGDSDPSNTLKLEV